MGSFLRTVWIAAAACALLGVAWTDTAAAAAPKVRWVGAGSNFTRADRPATSIRWVVIHTTEGGFLGSISWLRNPRARASAHYVISQRGEIVQMVRDTDIAWHAGNYTINRGSIGIEHEGYAGRPGSVTEAEYRASARLAAYVARRSLMPIDRKHFIGHADVPDPNNAKLKGGFSHHHDPGPHWQWGRYLSLVRAYARGATPPAYVTPVPKRPAPPKAARPQKPVSPVKPTTLSVATSWPKSGQTVTGFVPWHAAVVGRDVQRVDFLVDGRLRHTERQHPYTFGSAGIDRWDTTQEANGFHVLTLRVVTRGGRIAGSSTRVRVANTLFQVASASVANGQALNGRVRWEAAPTGGAADRVEYLVDGRLVHTEQSAPFTFDWDTRKEANGPHSLTLRGVSKDGRVALTTLGVTVENARPAPPPVSPFRVSALSLADGQSVQGVAAWTAATEGAGIERLEFHVDGVLRWIDTRSPYRFNGDGRWDAARERPGPHALVVKAVHKDGRTHSAGITVHAAARAPLTVRSSLADGATLRDPTRWEASVSGPAPERVEFLVDGRLRHTERSAPYTFDWAADRERAGAHAVVVRAVAADQRAEWSGTVTVEQEPPPPPVAKLEVEADGIAAGTVKGKLAFRASVTGTATRVELLVDGRLLHTERSAPYDFAWDTTLERDGAHELVLRAVAEDGTFAAASLAVTVANAVPAEERGIDVPGLADDETVSGVLELEAVVTGPAPRRVELWLDGTRIHVEQTAPYEFRWDTTTAAEGAHELVFRAVWSRGREARAERDVVVEQP